MGKVPEPVNLKRVLVLLELEDGSIGAAYSEDFMDDASVSVEQVEEPIRGWQGDLYVVRPTPSRYRVTIGDLTRLVVHDPGFHAPALAALAQAVMDQWRLEP